MEGAAFLSEADWFDGQDLQQYTRDHLLGRGSTGAVYLLRNDRTEDNDLAVVKELDVGRMAGRERHQAALEVRLLSELSHPNIIAYYGTVFNRRRQVLEIYMEYAEGGTLADLIAEKQNTPGAKGFEEQTVIRWTRQMLSALRCVHKRRIIHRDLKPSNVFITHDGSVKLADFGVSTELTHTSDQVLTVCGTPFYLSPEMVSGRPYTTATDVWSLGCILWELITLDRPFEGKNIMQLAMQIMSKELTVESLEERAHHEVYDKRLISMVVRMLDKDPTKRPTVVQLHDDPFLSERLGMLYLRHGNSGSAQMPSNGSFSRATGGAVAAALAAASAAVVVPLTPRERAVITIQAYERGRRDRVITGFLRGASGRRRLSIGNSSSALLDAPPQPPLSQSAPNSSNSGRRGYAPGAMLVAIAAPAADTSSPVRSNGRLQLRSPIAFGSAGGVSLPDIGAKPSTAPAGAQHSARGGAPARVPAVGPASARDGASPTRVGMPAAKDARRRPLPSGSPLSMAAMGPKGERMSPLAGMPPPAGASGLGRRSGSISPTPASPASPLSPAAVQAAFASVGIDPSGPQAEPPITHSVSASAALPASAVPASGGHHPPMGSSLGALPAAQRARDAGGVAISPLGTSPMARPSSSAGAPGAGRFVSMRVRPEIKPVETTTTR